MPRRSPDLHGSAPDACPAALLIVDMINDLEFETGERLLAGATALAGRLAEARRRARAAGVPVVYVNDNYGRWRSDFQALVRNVIDDDKRGKPLAEALAPGDDDYFVIKAKHSGFFATTLELLLGHLGVETLIITGLRTDSCVLFTAADAFLRDFRVVVPADGAVTHDQPTHDEILALMRRELKAETPPLAALDFRALARQVAAEETR